MAKKKSIEYKREDLINAVVKMRIDEGLSTKSIIDWLKNDMGFKHAYAYLIYKDARVVIMELYNRRNEAALEEAIGQLERMLEASIQAKNFRQALEIRKELNKIGGHYTEKIEVSGNMSHTVDVIRLNGPKKED
jgi:hypothetical protein